MVTRSAIAVIGAGLAGAACARTLAQAAHDVTVFDAAGNPATGASGNPLGILHSLISRDHNLASQWSEFGMACTLRWLKELQPLADASGLGRLGESCGVLQMNGDGSKLVCWDPMGAWIRPAALVQACLLQAQSHGARLRMNDAVVAINDDAELQLADGRWESFDAVVICAGESTAKLLPQAMLALNAIRGTISSYAVPHHVQGLPCVICASGYATPVIDGEMVVGASFERLNQHEPLHQVFSELPTPESETDEVAVSEFMSNLERLEIIAPQLAQQCQDFPVQERTSIRSATLDRMPHVGRILDHRITLSARVSRLEHMPRHPRLWVLGGLGSRGLSSAPLGAEMIAAQMQGRDLPIASRVAQAVDPVRFALRQHQRRVAC